MSTTLTLGQTLPLSVAELDQHGNPMTAFVTPDAPPVWSGPVGLTVATDGLSATFAPAATGPATLSLAVQIGGQVFSATLDVTVSPEAQVLTAVAIVPGSPA